MLVAELFVVERGYIYLVKVGCVCGAMNSWNDGWGQVPLHKAGPVKTLGKDFTVFSSNFMIGKPLKESFSKRKCQRPPIAF